MIWDDRKVVAFDFETSGTLPEYALQPWRIPTGDMWVTSVSLIEHTGPALEPRCSKLFPTRDDIATMLSHVIDNDLWVITWNGVFDISILIALGFVSEVHKINWLDGMLLWRHLEIEPEYDDKVKRRSYALKPGGIDRWLPMMAGYNEDVDFHATDPESLRKLQEYNDRDSVCTWIIGKLIWDSLSDSQRRCALIEASTLSMIAEANCRGMVIDTLVCRELEAMLSGKACRLLADLEQHGVTEKVIRSPRQLASLLFEQWGLQAIKQGKTGPSTDKEVLHELAFVDSRARQLKEYRESLNNRTKFAEGILASVAYCGDDRTHPGAIPFGTYSGRLTYSSKQGRGKDERPVGFALHQEKRDKFYRSVVIAPPGYTLLEFDASGQEYRWMAIASGDPTMLSLCQPGEDPHSYMGANIIGGDYHDLMVLVKQGDASADKARQLGKIANFSLQYRTSANKLRSVARVQYGIPMELPEATRIHRVYPQTYKRVPIYWQQQIALTQQRGWVETFAGRRVRVKGNWGGEFGWSMGSTAINYRIQGTGADQKYLAMSVIKDYLVSIGGQFAWDLHDGIYIYVPDDKVDHALITIKTLLDNLPYQRAWGFAPPIPLPWDAKRGKSWGSLKEVMF